MIQERSRVPTVRDLEWAAGFIEGEGTFSPTASTLSVDQKDPETLYRLQTLFGGSVRPSRSVYRWVRCGAHGRGIMMTLYSLLSHRRQAQICISLHTWLTSQVRKER